MNLNLQDVYHAHINGKNVPTSEYFDAVNATTGQLLSKIARCTVQEVNLAVEAAAKAQQQWKKTSYEERSLLLGCFDTFSLKK